jgi:hypothetical protein
MGRSQSAIATTPQQRLRPSGGYASEYPGTVATAARISAAISAGGGRPSRQFHQNGAGFSLLLHNINSSLQSVPVHAALGGGGPRWQPLNDTDRHALWARRQLESILAGGYGDGGIQLRPDNHSARPSAGEQLAVAAAERTGFVGDGF